MRIPLEDGNKAPMKNKSLYSNSETGDLIGKGCSVYWVSHISEDGCSGGAMDHQRNRYDLRMPRGLPDSSIVPEGVLYTSGLFPIDGEKIPGLREMLADCSKSLEEKVALLRSGLPASSP